MKTALIILGVLVLLANPWTTGFVYGWYQAWKRSRIFARQTVPELLGSEKFRNWGKHVGPLRPQDPALSEEKHYSPDELGALWGVSPQTIRNLFETEPGVLRIPSQRPGKKARRYVSIKIPESVAERVHKKYSSVAA